MSSRTSKTHGTEPAAVVPPEDAVFRTLLQHTSDIIALSTPGGVLRYLSPAAEGVLGYGPGECVGRNTFEWIHPDDAPVAIGAFTRLMQGSTDEQRTEYRIRHKDGGWRVLEISGKRLPDGIDVPGMVLTGRDVTERREAETARRRLSRILDATPDFVILSDLNGRVFHANEALRDALRLSDADVQATNLPDIFPPWATQVLVSEAIPTALTAGVWRGELALVNGTGEEIAISLVLLTHATADGKPEFLSTLARDITESKRVERALRESEERFRQVAENIEEVFWLIDAVDWRALYVSPAYERVWGRSPDDLQASLGTVLRDLHPDDRIEERDLADFFLGASEREYRIVRPDGAVRWIRSRSFPVRDADGAIYRVAGISEDITRRKQSDDQLLHLALHDSLTGLSNRAAFIHRLVRSLDRQEKHGDAAFTVLFVDLDRFKLINDSLGHLKGDELLVAIARRLEECVRPEDMVARFAGDEFAVLLHHTARMADAARVAERILGRLADPFQLDEHEVYTAGSIGIVPGSGYTRPEDLLRDADIAMYRAKMAGRGVYRVFDAAMHADAVARLQLEIDLRRAIERDEFQLYYQPVVSLGSGRVVGLEALLRWDHPERRLVLPSEFITAAEETGVIIPLGWWALRQACAQLKRWTRELPHLEALTVSVNLSGKHFSRRDLVTQVREILRETKLDPRRLKLEITETVIIENSEAAQSMFTELRQLGVQLQIDDFGTGYSSLGYLDRFPIDTLKIDRSLVARIGPTGEGGEIVRAVANLARNLGMTVVAEGVETLAQLEQLRKVECDFAQGYLFSKPIAASETRELLRKMPSW